MGWGVGYNLGFRCQSGWGGTGGMLAESSEDWKEGLGLLGEGR